MKYNNYNLYFEKSKYANNNTLAIIAMCEQGPFCWITVNLEGGAHSNYQYVAVNNVPNDLIQKMCEEGYMKPTGKTHRSGFVDFPLYDFNKKWLSTLKNR